MTVSLNPEVLGRAARCWCSERTKNIEMGDRLATEFAEVLQAEMSLPHLEYASNIELLEELKRRLVFNAPVSTPHLVTSISSDPTMPKEVLCQISHH